MKQSKTSLLARENDFVLNSSNQSSENFTQVLDGYGAEQLVIANSELLLKGDFSRIGSDLVIVGPEGNKILVMGYFANLSPPELTTPGGSVLPPDLVELLAGSPTPGQYSQLGDDATTSEPIGVVETAVGDVTVTRLTGEQITLSQGSPVFQGDIVETSTDSALGITFADSSTFSLGDEGRIVLDEMIYDPVTQEGSSVFSVVQGVFLFVSGEIAAENPDGMVVRTPVATLGIRGTKVAGKAAQEGDLNTITLMPDADGSVGQIVVSNPTGSVTLQSAFQTTAVSSTFLAPSQAITLSGQQAGALFGSVDRVLQNQATVNNNTTDENRDTSGNVSSPQDANTNNNSSENLGAEAGEPGIGPEGPEGEFGPEGPEGEFGPEGPEGEFGPEGPEGDFGPEGPGGEFGPDGPGDFGPDGPGGEFGPDGPEGEFGPEGPIGPQEDEAFADAAWDAFESALDEGKSLEDAAKEGEVAAKELAKEVFGDEFDEEYFDASFQESAELINLEAQEGFGPEGPSEAGPDGPGSGTLIGGEGLDTLGPEGPEGEFGPEGPEGEFGPEGPEGEFGPEGPEGEFDPEGPGEFGPDGPGDFGPDGPGGEFGPDGPGGFGPEGPGGEFGPEGPGGEFGPDGQGKPGPEGPDFGPDGPPSLFVSSGPIYGDPWGSGYGGPPKQEGPPAWLEPPEIGIGKGYWGEPTYVLADDPFGGQPFGSPFGFSPFGIANLFNPFGAGFDTFNVFLDPGINDDFFFGPQKQSVPLLQTGNAQQLANTDTAVDGPVLTGLGLLLHQSGTATNTFTSAGTVFVGGGVINDTDNAVPSGLLIDNIQKNGQLVIGFESGSLEGLQFIGNVAVVGKSGSIDPTQGNFQSFLLAGATPVSQIESFLGVDFGTLSFGGAVNPTFGSAIGAFVDVVPGDTITFDFDFLDAESAGGNAFNFFKDFAFATFGEQGVDKIVGTNGNDVLQGTDKNDVIEGLAGADVIDGGAGNDIILGGTGSDTMDGGAGTDTLSFFDLSASVNASLSSGSATSGSDTDSLQNFENLLGTSANDILTGDGNANSLDGSSGNDTLTGNAGNDELIGGPGADTLIGGDGTDTANFAAENAVTVSLSAGTATIGSVVDTLSSIENIIGSAFDDTIAGTSGVETITGGSGSDTLTGGGGGDTFSYTNSGEGAGINSNSTLSGTILATDGVDEITDFVSGTDKIGIASGFNIQSIITSGSQQNFFTTTSYNGTNSGAAPGIDHLIFDTTADVLIYDDDVNTVGYTILAETDNVTVLSTDISIV